MQIENNNKKKQIWKLQQLLKVKADEDLPQENEKDEEQRIPSQLLAFEKQTYLPSTGSHPEIYELSIRNEDICKLSLIKLINQPNLSKLTHFSLDLTNLIVQQSNILLLCSLLSKLSNLKSLNLVIQKNKLKDEHVEQLSLCFQAMRQVESLKLNMYQCKATNRGLTLLTHSLSQLSYTLTILALNLNGNQFDIFGLKNVCGMIGEFTKLQELELYIGDYLSSNREIIDLFQCFHNLSLLITLILRFYNVQFNQLEFEAQTKSISKMVLLEKLEFSFIACNLGFTQTSCIFQCIQPLVSLKHLQLYFYANAIAKKQLVALTKKFKYFKTLQTIKFKLDIFGVLNEEDDEYRGDFQKAIQQFCMKNARSLVKYEILITCVLE